MSLSDLSQLVPAILFAAAIVGLLLYFRHFGRPTTVTLLPYQRGVLFKRGKPVRDCGPGKHRVQSGTELLVHLDVRPISIHHENLVVSLQDGYVAGYGISGSVQVGDVRKALYSARNYAHVPPATLLRCTRKELSACSSEALRTQQNAIAGRIAEQAKARLEAAGFELLSFRLTQLVVGTLRQPEPQSKQNLSSPGN